MTDKEISTEFLKLVEIMAILRAPGGCPWDREQTPETLKPFMLEEVYEVIEAIDNRDSADICDELGDLLLQVVFIAQIFSEEDEFGIADVARAISSKLIRRHPHVFADATVDDHAWRWETIKQQERSARGKGQSLADRIPTNLPALKKATKVASKIPEENPLEQIHKIEHDFSHLSQLIDEADSGRKQFENILGEILFSTTQLAHSLQIDAEDLLRKKTMQVITEIDR